MNTIDTSMPTAAVSAPITGSGAPKPSNARQAAQQFEALLIGEMLRMGHEDDKGWLGTGDDSTASSAMGFAEESLAQSIAANGGLGLAKVIEKTLPQK